MTSSIFKKDQMPYGVALEIAQMHTYDIREDEGEVIVYTDAFVTELGWTEPVSRDLVAKIERSLYSDERFRNISICPPGIFHLRATHPFAIKDPVLAQRMAAMRRFDAQRGDIAAHNQIYSQLVSAQA